MCSGLEGSGEIQIERLIINPFRQSRRTVHLQVFIAWRNQYPTVCEGKWYFCRTTLYTVSWSTQYSQETPSPTGTEEKTHLLCSQWWIQIIFCCSSESRVRESDLPAVNVNVRSPPHTHTLTTSALKGQDQSQRSNTVCDQESPDAAYVAWS